jgi:cellulose 1,4-beta-cellobiosidase
MEDMQNIYGVTSTGDDLRLNFFTQGGDAPNVGSRFYMMKAGGDSYEMFKLRNKEFTFDVDFSNLPCGINGALYFVEMPEGGDYQVGNNNAGPNYGTGYCDAQCPHDIKFIKGKANIEDWDSSTQHGKQGICCAEMDIWEANSMASAYTLHPCKGDGQTVCEDDVTCGDGTHRFDEGSTCDADGCDWNPYRTGTQDFYGKGMEVDTSRPFTVVTQFVTEDGTDNSDITDVIRFFVQDGKKIEYPDTAVAGQSKAHKTINDEMCEDIKGIFGDNNDYKNKGGMKKMSDSLNNGMVLVMSLWDDHDVNMLWLDSTYPTTGGPGAARGPCSIDSGKPDDVEANDRDSYVKYSNIRFGEIGSTTTATIPEVEFLQ